MRVSVVIFSLILAQTSASFFSELTSSISSVQSSIGKFISNTAYDIKDTFDCTVFAVRQALGTLDTTLPEYQKCISNQNMIPLSPSRPVQIYITPLIAPTPTDVIGNSQPEKKEEPTLKPTPKSTNNNTKVYDDLKNKSIESELLGETRTLVNMSSKLEREFEDLSKHVNEDLTKIENEEKLLSTQKVMKERNKLLEEEINYKNNTDSEIREAFDKIITKLDNNNTAKFTLKEEIKSALAELEHNKNQTNTERELKMWKEEELKSLDDIKNLLKKQEQNNTMKPDETSTRVINTMRPIEASFQRPKSVITARTAKRAKSALSKRTLSSTDTVLSTKATKKTHVARKLTKKRPKTKKTSTTTPNDYDSLVSEDKSTLDVARKLVGNSKKAELIMASILRNSKSATSVFDRPELL